MGQSSSTSNESNGRRCTYIETGDVGVVQPIYRCLTCEPDGNLAMCHACTSTCHGGHRVLYASYCHSSCQCGTRGEASCKCLTSRPRSSTASAAVQKDALLGSFECPICLTTMSSPMYLCVQGHNVCGNCKAKGLTACPLCRGEMSQSRNVGLEALARALRLPCEDCGKEVAVAEYEGHRAECPVLNQPCPLQSGCEWRGKSSDVEDHCKKEHAQDVLTGGEHVFSVPLQGGAGGRSIKKIIKTEKGVFYHHSELCQTGEVFKATVKHIRAAVTPKLWYTLIFDSSESGERIVFKKTVRPLEEDVDEIYRLCNGAILHLDQTTALLYTDCIKYTLQINSS